MSTLVYLFLESKAREPIGGLPCTCMEIRNDKWYVKIYVVVNFSSQVIFVFLLFWGMVMYANEVETKEK